MSRILVTGGAGFIGNHLIERLLSDGHFVVSIDNMSTGQGFPSVLDEEHAWTGDIANENNRPYNWILWQLNNLKIDYIFHLAAHVNLRRSFLEPTEDAQTNIIGTLNLLKAARTYGKVKKFIFASTGGAMYDTSAAVPWSEQSPIAPQSPYALAKSCAEKYIELLCPCPYNIMRFSNVYGPKQNPAGEAGVIAIFVDKLIVAKTGKITIFGDGTQTRDYVYVDDVIDALMASMSSDTTGTYNVSTAEETTVNTIAKHIVDYANLKNITVLNEPFITGEMLRSCLSYDKIKLDMGWRPKVDITDGIVRTINWFKKNG